MGERIAILLKKKKVSQKDLAMMIGVTEYKKIKTEDLL